MGLGDPDGAILLMHVNTHTIDNNNVQLNNILCVHACGYHPHHNNLQILAHAFYHLIDLTHIHNIYVLASFIVQPIIQT